MTRIAVLDDYQKVAASMADWSTLDEECKVDFFHENIPGGDEAAAKLADYDVICLMRERMKMPADLLARLPKLKLVVATGTNARMIDLDAAAAQGITVCGTGGGQGGVATPELAWALILAASRHLVDEHANVRAGRWQESVGTALNGGTLGLVGLGRLGRKMVPVAKAFGMRVLAWSPNLTPERAAEGGAEFAEKETLFREADAVSIHLVLGPRTRGLVGEGDLLLMKPGAILVNTSRGPIVDEAALLAALQEGRIRAGLDVYDVEPLPREHPLRRAPNVVLSPHLGYVTQAGYAEFYEGMVEDIRAWRQGSPVRVLAAPAG
ncbi:D-2-hydroxyacid dehydrogenase family protein [Lutibaculum baratangense]|uniref:D-3-phosphoglycerate dehydrogenase n=1 Tax=Lutibaculum baratangense AMV1 TaxID=631454 RepID=V4RDG4_9HYPH|nr:D-2-hydroxyacid dehydrogenase family protein [Lutibaculum baratangense]ESR23394.1 D-3-phosphoglycerate dehydrogenase [Lutibaculum baratangense AMV1]